DVLIFDVIFTKSQFRQQTIPEPLPYDPEEAKRLLDAAGWRDQDGDGVRTRAGEEFRFNALVPGREIDVVGMQKAAIYVQEQLRRVGVRMEVQPLSPGVVRPRLRTGDFEAVFHRFFNETSGHLRTFGENSPLGYSNPRLIALLETAKITIDPDARDQLYQDIMKIFQEDMPLTFLFPQIQTFIAHRRLRGLQNPFWGGDLRHIEDLWLEDED
ncbi:MAG: ABC transporter substrate-binding protein, partial [Candidatus Binatia bacterium]